MNKASPGGGMLDLMNQRLINTIPVCLLSILIFWGLFHLQRIFLQERDDAYAELQARHDTLRQYAVNALALRLRNELQSRWIQVGRILEDPLRNSNRYYYAVDGHQRLPKLAVYGESDGEGKKLHEKLLHADPIDLTNDDLDPWPQRLNYFAELKSAMRRKDMEEARWTFRRIREYRVRSPVEPGRDLPFVIAVLDYMYSKVPPYPFDVANMLSGDSVLDREQGRAGLFRELLEARHEFGESDFQFLAAKLKKFALLSGANVDDYVSRMLAPTQPLSFPPVTRPLIWQGQWYLEPFAQNGVRGYKFNNAELIQRIQDEMVLLELLDLQDLIIADFNGAQAADGVSLRIDSPLWPKRRQAIREQFYIKSVLLYSGTVFMVAAAVLLFMTLRRKHRVLNIKQEFVAAVTHELKTPLAAIRLMAETLQRKLKDNPAAKDYPQRMIGDIDQLGYLIDNILQFNRIARTVELRRESVSLYELCARVLREQTSFGGDIVMDYAQMKGLYVQGDPDWLQLVFSNLCNNACRYNQSSPVRIRIRRKANSLFLRDNGIGIADGEKDRVFEAFFRGAAAGQSRGTGLGLALCRRIMKLHRGNIRVESSGDQGTEFELIFQAIEEHRDVTSDDTAG